MEPVLPLGGGLWRAEPRRAEPALRQTVKEAGAQPGNAADTWHKRRAADA
jgi:hypothetical protein